MLIKFALEAAIAHFDEEVDEGEITQTMPTVELKRLQEYRDILDKLLHDEIALNMVANRLLIP